MKMLVPVVHIVGALLLFVSLGVEWAASGALGRSPTVRKAERWAARYSRSFRGQIAAAAAILASGVAMAARLEAFQFAWVNVSLVSVLLIAALAGILSRSQRGAADHRIGQLSHPAIRIGLALAVSYLMVAKSELGESLIVVALAVTVAAVVATRTKTPIRVSSGDAPGAATTRV